MECEGAPDGASMARTAEHQVDVTMMEIIDLAMTKETGQTEAEVEEESSTEAKQPGNQEPTKGKQSGRTTERERNITLAHKYIAAQRKQAELQANALLWMAERIPEICNQAIAMAKGDSVVKMLASSVSAVFRTAVSNAQQGATPTGNAGNKVTKERGHEVEQSKPKGKLSYASVAKQANGRTSAPVALKEKTGPKSPKRVEKKVRIFVRGPVTTKEENMGTELAKIFGGTPKEFAVKKVNSGWAFYADQGKATEKNMERAKEACGAKVCEIDNKWNHARITGLSDFYVLSDKGPVPTKNEEWFTGQIARQTGGQVKAIKWQIEAEKYKDATLRVAIDLPEGKTLPSAMKFEGSNNAANAAPDKRTNCTANRGTSQGHQVAD
ncbi:hypothetical protein CFO_g5614 [Ceratocystis platani]|uniref:Uncharacterized protein n=1 Tax=Ceratocystis fimbriata f. sp. platani TaxID=88771 RepID=A0A0F8D7D8_CERFI|nr:hypothetical protein CFO_g5614 [Ceratocystis platani]